MHVPQAFVEYVRQPAHSGHAVWRYMSLAKFVWMISKRQLRTHGSELLHVLVKRETLCERLLDQLRGVVTRPQR
jgi:hypothetical protein